MFVLVDKLLSCCGNLIYSASNEGNDEIDWLVDDYDDLRFIELSFFKIARYILFHYIYTIF